MLFNALIKTTLQSIAAIIPIVTPIIIFLLFIRFILQIPIYRSSTHPNYTIKRETRKARTVFCPDFFDMLKLI